MMMPTKHFRNLAKGKKGNVMTPISWSSGFAEMLLVSGMIASEETWVRIFLGVLAFGVVAFYCTVYWYWMKNDPDRLQTEEYQLLSHQMSLLGTTENDDTLDAEVTSTLSENEVRQITDAPKR